MATTTTTSSYPVVTDISRPLRPLPTNTTVDYRVLKSMARHYLDRKDRRDVFDCGVCDGGSG